MVLKSEATCPKCFMHYQYCSKLVYDDARKRFFCPNDEAHVFVEDENGYLKSQ